MKVSFDLDDTLFVSSDNVDTETSLNFPFNYIYKEKLRLGTVNIMKNIINNNIELWIYTTSFRSKRYIKGYFKKYGIKININNIVNGKRHMDEVQGDRKEILPSKYPPKYKINLHVDDDISVKQNGDIYGFKVFLIKVNNTNWIKELWEMIESIRKSGA
jgi:hypothetical protein